MVLADEMWEGKPRKLLFHGDRNGIFYVLDRTNGTGASDRQLSTKVTWVKGFTADGKPIVDPGSIATQEGIAACPGGGGGANFHAVSYNPVTRLFYVRVSDSCQVYTSHEDPLGRRGNRWFGPGPASEKARAALAALTEGIRHGRSTFARWIRSRRRKSGISRILEASLESCRRPAASCFSPVMAACWSSMASQGSCCTA